MGEDTRDKPLRGGEALTPNPPALFLRLSLPRLRGEAGKGLRGPGRPNPPARGSVSAPLGLERFPK